MSASGVDVDAGELTPENEPETQEVKKYTTYALSFIFNPFSEHPAITEFKRVKLKITQQQSDFLMYHRSLEYVSYNCFSKLTRQGHIPKYLEMRHALACTHVRQTDK